MFPFCRRQADLFTKYFHGCPAITIPGRTFPVEVRLVVCLRHTVDSLVSPTALFCFSSSSPCRRSSCIPSYIFHVARIVSTEPFRRCDRDTLEAHAIQCCPYAPPPPEASCCVYRGKPHQISYMDDVNRVIRRGNTPAIMPRVSSGAGPAGGRGNGRGGGAAQASSRGTGARGQPSAAAGAAAARQRQKQAGEENDEDVMTAAYDPLTGEPLELDEDGNPNAEAAAAVSAMVSPKCEDKLDYGIMIDLVDHIMRTEGDGGGGQNGSDARNRGGGGGRGGGAGAGRGRGGRQGQGRGGGGGSGSGGGAQSRGGRGAAAVGSGEPLGAILVFLPGFAEIDQLVKGLERHPRIGKGARVFPLHSSLPSNQQRAIFQRMPPGVRKIVVSTNIAETSVRCAAPLL